MGETSAFLCAQINSRLTEATETKYEAHISIICFIKNLDLIASLARH